VPNIKARSDCREVDYNTPQGTPLAGGLRDCTPNDGALNEGDCVGQDTENIVGGLGDDVLTGNDPDPLVGKAASIEPLGVNHLQGGPRDVVDDGDDVLDGRLGADIFEGGGGTDTVTYADRTESVIASIDGATNDGVPGQDDSPSGLSGDAILSDVEVLIGGSNDDTLKGDDGSGTLDSGDDQLFGGPGADFLDGGSGSDTLNGGEGGDLLAGGDGNDQLVGGPGDDIVDGEAGSDDVQGEGGLDVLDYSAANTPVHVNPNGVADDGRAGEGDNVAGDFEKVLGGSDGDHLIGGPEAELLAGNDGNDRLDGGGGGDDLSGGAGADTVSYEARSAPVFVNLAEAGNDGEAGENDHVFGDVEKVLGGSGGDTLLGDARDNVLLGAAGNDRLAGAEGDDLLIGDVGNDTLSGDAGNDTLLGSDGNDNLSGADGNDDLKGEAGNDTIDGGRGKDRHFGGPHVDTILYSARSAGVTVSLDGAAGNGERSEDDFINHDVENVTTGSGGDTIDADDNLKGEVKCGAGTDIVTVDSDDRVAGDCETVRVAAFGTRCTASTASVRMRRSGAIGVRVFCGAAAKGTLRLQSIARVRSGKGRARRVLKLGSKSFSLKAGQRRTISVRASKTARRYIQRKKRLSVRARISSKATTQRSTLRTSRVFTVRAPRR
jgi:Ca2+-binding RTX toxin-like protein